MLLFFIEFMELKFQFLFGWKHDIKFLSWRENEGEWLLNPGISAPPAWATPRSLGQGLTTSSDRAPGASPDKPAGNASFLHLNNTIQKWSLKFFIHLALAPVPGAELGSVSFVMSYKKKKRSMGDWDKPM